MAAAKQGKLLGLSADDVQKFYEDSILSTLRPQLVVNIACAKDKTLMLLADGIIYEFPRGGLPRPIDMPARARGRIKQLACGENHFVALTDHLTWNVYTWGSMGVSDELLGRDLTEKNASPKIPDVVKDLPGRVVRITCGSDLTICETAVGDLWAFGPSAFELGASTSSRTVPSLVIKTTLSGPAEIQGGCVVSLTSSKTSSNQSMGEVRDERSNDLLDLLGESEVPPIAEWFVPGDAREEMLMRHAENARYMSVKLGREAVVMRKRESETRLRLEVLVSRVMRQEARTEDDARVMLPFARFGGFAIPPVASSMSSEDSVNDLEDSEVDEGSFRQSMSHVLKDESLKPLRVRKRSVHLSRIRDTLAEERKKDGQARAKDASVCASRLNESTTLLRLLRSELAETQRAYNVICRTARESELSAKDLRTQALLLERAMLRIKRERREMDGFEPMVGECRVFPSHSWTSFLEPAICLRIQSRETALDTGSSWSTSRGMAADPVVWVRCRMDPDWSLRINMTNIIVSLGNFGRSGHEVTASVLKRVLISKKSQLGDANPFKSSMISVSAMSNRSVLPPTSLLVPAKHVLSDVGGTTLLSVIFQRHALVELSQRGEDCVFHLGFVLTHKVDPAAFAEGVSQVRILVEDDAKVAESLRDEVAEINNFDAQKHQEWENLAVEVL